MRNRLTSDEAFRTAEHYELEQDSSSGNTKPVLLWIGIMSPCLACGWNYLALAVVVGSVVFTVVVQLATLASITNAYSIRYQRKMETTRSVIGKLQLPVLRRERIYQ